MIGDDLLRFEDLWTQSDWVVWEGPDGDLLPFNLNGHVKLIENDDLARRVCEHMIKMGRPVVTELPKLVATAQPEQKP